jgi:hypothetical protein
VRSCGRFERTTLLTLDLVMTILLFIYVPTRLSLLAQALALLRSQTPSALFAVNWPDMCHICFHRDPSKFIWKV